MHYKHFETKHKKAIASLMAGFPDKYTGMFLKMNLNDIIPHMFNTHMESSRDECSEEPSIEILSLVLSKLAQIYKMEMPSTILHEVYKMEEVEYVFADVVEVQPELYIKNINDLLPIRLSLAYDYEIKDLSSIKIRGTGELKIHMRNGEMLIEAKNEWDIEEILKIEGSDHSTLIEYGKAGARIIKEFVIAYLITMLMKI